MAMCLGSSALSLGLLCWSAQAAIVECNQECQQNFELEDGDPDAASLLQTALRPKRVGLEKEEPQEVILYPWSSRGQNAQTSTSTESSAPSNFSINNGSVLWSNPEDEEIRHTPLIDDENNIYIASTTHIRKVDSDGKLLWDYFVPEGDGSMRASPALYDGFVFFMSALYEPPTLVTCALNMKTGEVEWKTNHAGTAMSVDSQAVLALNNTVVFPILQDPKNHEGSDSLLALKTSDGSKLWEYNTDDVMWNFKPSSPGDGSIIFSSSCGAVHKIDFDGKVIWKNDAPTKPPPGTGFCSMGGGAAGPNGVFYAEHGEHLLHNDLHGDVAHINAYNISDGKLLWSKTFNEFGGQYPAVGYLGEKLAVLAPIGTSLSVTLPDGGPLGSNRSKWRTNSVVAMDAETGDVIWQHKEKPWPFMAAAGDFGPDFVRRIMEKKTKDPRREMICLPDPQGIPLISGDGHVYVSNSQNGDLSAIKDVDGDGKITPDEVSTFPTKVGFLNSPSLAAGMLVAAPCWGPVYIFKE